MQIRTRQRPARFLSTFAALACIATSGCDEDPALDGVDLLEDSASSTAGFAGEEDTDDEETDAGEETDGGDTDDGGDTEDIEDGGEPGDEFSADLEPSFALGDITCATSSNTDVVTDWGCDLIGGESCYYLTPNTDYQTDYSSGEDCQSYQTFKTQTASMTSTVSMTHWAVWGGPLPTSQSSCERSHVELAVYEFDQNTGGWYHRTSRDRQGTWNGSSCSFGWVQAPNTATCNSLGRCQTGHAVTAKAYTSNLWFFPTPHKVYLGTYRN